MSGPAPGARTFTTPDLSLAAYLSESGMILRKAGRARSGDFEFVFDDRDARAAGLAVEWTNSCCRDFESRIRSLKTLLHSGNGARPRR